MLSMTNSLEVRQFLCLKVCYLPDVYNRMCDVPLQNIKMSHLDIFSFPFYEECYGSYGCDNCVMDV